MFRIGLIGTENSHALAFAKYFNLPNEDGKYNEADMRVTAILGTDKEANAKIVAETGVEFVAEKAEDFFGRVDAVMITCRKGSEHMQYALPFVEKKIPLFIDKPFTSDVKEAEYLMAKIREHNCPVMGGSACKYLPDVLKVKEKVAQLREAGEFVSAVMSFKVMLDTEWDGLYFYTPHLVEMCLEAFGFDIKNIQAIRTGDSIMVTAQYENDAVSLHFQSRNKQPACFIYGRLENFQFDISTLNLYALECAPFAELVRGNRESLRPEQLVKPVYVIAAMEEALATGKTVSME